MGQARPTFERRQLGLTLRRLRDAAGVTQQVAADAVGKVRSRIVQLEDGTATASEKDLTTLLDCYGVTGVERDTVLDLGAKARRRQQPRVHVDHLPDSYRRIADLEAGASEINSFETGIIPGLLQSEGYIRSLLAESKGIWPENPVAELEDRLAYRLERQQRVLSSGDRRILRFVITEDALRANLGSPEVMRDQVAHLLRLIRKHRDLTVRVLRNDEYGNPARGHGFLVFGFGDRGAPIGFAPSVISPSTYYDDERDTGTMLRMFYRVWELALSRQDSTRLMQGIAKE